jgi:hypothetical protein
MPTKHQLQQRSKNLSNAVQADKAKLQAYSRSDVMDDRSRASGSPLGGPDRKLHEQAMKKAKGAR